jgi:hypothetical protein
LSNESRKALAAMIQKWLFVSCKVFFVFQNRKINIFIYFVYNFVFGNVQFARRATLSPCRSESRKITSPTEIFKILLEEQQKRFK